jgi:hypothetical protein
VSNLQVVSKINGLADSNYCWRASKLHARWRLKSLPQEGGHGSLLCRSCELGSFLFLTKHFPAPCVLIHFLPAWLIRNKKLSQSGLQQVINYLFEIESIGHDSTSIFTFFFFFFFFFFLKNLILQTKIISGNTKV